MVKKYSEEDYLEFLCKEKVLNEEGLKNTSPEILKIYRSEEQWDETASGHLYRPGRKLILPRSMWKRWKGFAKDFYVIGEQRLTRDPQTRILYLETWNGERFVRDEKK